MPNSKIEPPDPPMEKPPHLEHPWESHGTCSSDVHSAYWSEARAVKEHPKRRAVRQTQNYEWNRTPIFANAEDMKERVRQKLTKESYNVMDFYKKKGCAQFIARHSIFESVTLLVVGLNALWIWIDTDFNSKDLLTDAHPIFQIAEHFFCLYFFTEICTRFAAFEQKLNCMRDPWFVFDSFLVIVMALETWVMTIVILSTSSKGTSTNLGDTSILRIARLLRLMRMARVARLLRAMPELVILLKGIVAAARSVFFTLVLLLLLMYVFAIAFTQMLRDESVGNEFFKTVPQSMHTLWLRGTLLDEVWEVMEEVQKVSLFYVFLLDLFILAAALTVMNMLVGVLCEVVSAVAAFEREEINLSLVKSKVERIFNELGLDKNNNKMISKREFVQIVDNREAARAIQDLGVDVVGLVDFAEVFFSADTDDETYSKELSFSEFMEAVVSLRGSNTATVKDIIDLRKVVMNSMSKQDRQVQEVFQLVQFCNREEKRKMQSQKSPKSLGRNRRATDPGDVGATYTNGPRRPPTPTNPLVEPAYTNGPRRCRRSKQDDMLRIAAHPSSVPLRAFSSADSDTDVSKDQNQSWDAMASTCGTRKPMGIPGMLDATAHPEQTLLS